MGILTKIFGGWKSAQPSRTRSSHSLKPWPGVTPSKAVVIPGDQERKVYVYDSRPLAGTRKGQIIALEAFAGDATMTSVHTGTVSSTGNGGETCLLYNGKPVGFVSIPLSQVKEGAAAGLRFVVRCKVLGTVKGYSGVTELVALLPPRVYASDFVDAHAARAAGVPQSAKEIEYHEYDAEDFHPLLRQRTEVEDLRR